MLNRQSKVLFLVLLAVSILLHLLAWWWVDITALFDPDPIDDSTTVHITLQQPPAQPTPPEQPQPEVQKNKPKEKQVNEETVEEERHLPMHNADTFASSNNTDRSATELKPDELVDKDEIDVTGEKTKDNKKEELKADKTERAKAQTVVSNDNNLEKKPENTDEKPDIDETNSEQKSRQVFSEKQSDKVKMQNLYLARMMKQITENLVQPRKPVRPGRGTIHIVLGSDGYLMDAKISKSSGDFVLDLSVMEAIKRVHRFEVPASRKVAEKYYQRLVIRYDETIFDQ
ncbi:cell envelope integrity protein TolA [Alkalimarinus coralli]|uniref:cell envelope integrity protein TolA n=1 Tax=Alkalimarinus coralli TaxID=2935863 RepID=UPI00202AF196|nr:cell envelope integrity protein TolA [Alkalimarinus coralli]